VYSPTVVAVRADGCGMTGRLGLLLGYLLMPIDLVPDFLPVIGYADDAIIVASGLRSVVRAAGPEVIAAHWPGTDTGLTVLHRLAGLPAPETRAGRSEHRFPPLRKPS
jgi:hypothetical protein